MNSPPPSLLLLPKGPSHTTAQSVHDKKPLIWDESSEALKVSSDAESSACLVCRHNVARYKCPNCDLQYCSVSCYRSHDEEKGESCTEDFYRRRVEGVLQVEVSEQRQKTVQILNRIYHESKDIATPESEEVPLDDLCKLLDLLEADDEEGLESLMAQPHMRKALGESLAKGDLQHAYLASWQPWWCRELVSQKFNQLGDLQLSGPANERKTLDERLLQIPRFRSIYFKEKIPYLHGNLVDLLYSFSSTIRLYHGAENASEMGLDSASTLVQSSTVLAQDARFRTVQEALISCMSASTRLLEPSAECHTQWDVLVRDVATLVKSPRFIGRALFESLDIVSSAINKEKKAGNRENVGALRKHLKKLEFFLSWSREVEEISFLDTSATVEQWLLNWSLQEATISV